MRFLVSLGTSSAISEVGMRLPRFARNDRGELLNNLKIKALNLDIRICLEFSALSSGFPDSDGGGCP